MYEYIVKESVSFIQNGDLELARILTYIERFRKKNFPFDKILKIVHKYATIKTVF